MDTSQASVPYDDIPVLPSIIAETVCSEVYTGQEWSLQRRPGIAYIERIEAARKAMTPEQVREFAGLADTWCHKAYEQRVSWMLDAAEAKDSSGRDSLYVFIRHWMVAYLTNPVAFRAHHAA